MSNEKLPYEAPSIEEIETGDAPISTAAGQANNLTAGG
jgi:hypothetical protein